jgi:hypothetical protein
MYTVIMKTYFFTLPEFIIKNVGLMNTFGENKDRRRYCKMK